MLGACQTTGTPESTVTVEGQEWMLIKEIRVLRGDTIVQAEWDWNQRFDKYGFWQDTYFNCLFSQIQGKSVRAQAIQFCNFRS